MHRPSNRSYWLAFSGDGDLLSSLNWNPRFLPTMAPWVMLRFQYQFEETQFKSKHKHGNHFGDTRGKSWIYCFLRNVCSVCFLSHLDRLHVDDVGVYLADAITPHWKRSH